MSKFRNHLLKSYKLIQPQFCEYLYNNGIVKIDLQSGLYDIEIEWSIRSISSPSNNLDVVEIDKQVISVTSSRWHFIWNYLTNKDSLTFPRQISIGDRMRTTITCSSSSSATMYSKDNATGASKTSTSSVTSSHATILPTVSGYSVNIFSIKISNGLTKEVVYNFKPCLYGSVYGFWNTIDNKFYGKTSGSGSFLGGPQV